MENIYGVLFSTLNESVFYSKIKRLYRMKQNNLKVIKKYLNSFEIHNSIYFIVTVD